MAGVFLSYDRDDTDRARPIALALEKAGHEVWWDLHVRGGAQFSKVIEEALKAADVVVVLWSANSIESAWVRDEAAAGRDSGRLIPVTIDGIQAPMGFRQFQTIDLSGWRGRGRPTQLKALLADVAAMAGETKPKPAPPTDRRPVFPSKMHIGAVAALLLLVVAGALVLWRPWAGRAVPSLVVRPAANDAGSRALASDLVVKLGSLQSLQSAPVQLIGPAEAQKRKPDLLLEVAATTASEGTGANAILKSPKNGIILWSKDFENPSRNPADLKQQLAFTTSRVLGCAGEGLDPSQRRLGDETLRLYINSCAQLAELGTSEPLPLLANLRQVVKRAPGFAGAWRKLLLVEGEVVEAARERGAPNMEAEQDLRRDINEARRLDPRMSEATLAEIAFLQRDDLLTRMQLADRAKAANPTHPIVLQERAVDLTMVGRMREAIDDAQRALELDPLSPDAHASYFAALLYGGHIESAQQELREVERLWPDSTTALDLEFRFNLRDGDPRKALPRAAQQGLRGLEKFLEARIDPAKVPSYVSWLVERKDFDLGRLTVLISALGQFHREDELYRIVFGWPNPKDVAAVREIWFRPQLHQFRRDPRFILVMARTPMLKYWRTTGKWPDFCFEMDLPYDCKKEAAKYA